MVMEKSQPWTTRGQPVERLGKGVERLRIGMERLQEGVDTNTSIPPQKIEHSFSILFIWAREPGSLCI